MWLGRSREEAQNKAGRLGCGETSKRRKTPPARDNAVPPFIGTRRDNIQEEYSLGESSIPPVSKSNSNIKKKRISSCSSSLPSQTPPWDDSIPANFQPNTIKKDLPNPSFFIHKTKQMLKQLRPYFGIASPTASRAIWSCFCQMGYNGIAPQNPVSHGWTLDGAENISFSQPSLQDILQETVLPNIILSKIASSL